MAVGVFNIGKGVCAKEGGYPTRWAGFPRDSLQMRPGARRAILPVSCFVSTSPFASFVMGWGDLAKLFYPPCLLTSAQIVTFCSGCAHRSDVTVLDDQHPS